MDWRVFAFTAAIGISRSAVRRRPGAARHVGGAGGCAARSRARHRQRRRPIQLGHALVALQVALSFVLVFGSTLFVRTLVGLTTQGMGFESDRVLIATVDLRRTGATPSSAPADVRAAREAVAAVPGVEAAAGIIRDAGQRQHVATARQRARVRRAGERARGAVQRRDAGLLPRDAARRSSPAATSALRTQPIGRASRSSTRRSPRSSITAKTRSARPSSIERFGR